MAASTWRDFTCNSNPTSLHHSYHHLALHLLFSMDRNWSEEELHSTITAPFSSPFWNQPFSRVANSDLYSLTFGLHLRRSLTAVQLGDLLSLSNSTAKYSGACCGLTSLDPQSCYFCFHLSISCLLLSSKLRSGYEVLFIGLLAAPNSHVFNQHFHDYDLRYISSYVYVPIIFI